MPSPGTIMSVMGSRWGFGSYRFVVALAVVLLGACAGGPTSNIPGPVRDPILTVQPPFETRSGQSVSFDVSIEFGQEPFTLDCAFGGGAVPDHIDNLEVNRVDAVPVQMAAVTAETVFHFSFTLTSAYGATDSFSGTFRVLPPEAPRQAPVIVSALLSDSGNTLTVVADDPDSEELDVSVTAPAGVSTSPLSQTVSRGSPAVFTVSYNGDPPAGGWGELQVRVEDADGLSTTLNVDLASAPLPEPEFKPNHLYAIPLAVAVTVGEPVRILVRTGRLPNPFQFLTGVRVTVDAGATFVPGSFNTGAPGGSAYAVDGLWSAMSPLEFVQPPGGVNPAPVDVGEGRVGFDFGLAPAAGMNLSDAVGELFSFELQFESPGTYTLGFQQDDGLPRTYYGWSDDGGVSTTSWGDLSNSLPGVPNAVIVAAE